MFSETKRCTKCGETKPVSEFWKSKQAKDGLQCWCKQGDVARKTPKCATPESIAHFKAHRKCYMAKARKLAAGFVVDPACGGE